MIVGKLVAWAPVVGAPVVEQVIVDLLVLGQPVNRRSSFLPEVCQDRSFLCSTRFGFPVIAGWRFPGDRAGTGNAQGGIAACGGVATALFNILHLPHVFFAGPHISRINLGRNRTNVGFSVLAGWGDWLWRRIPLELPEFAVL